MRHTFLLLVSISAIACQSAQQGDDTGTPAAGTGSTTYSRGTPDTSRSETTRVSGGDRSRGGATLTLDRASYSAGATVTMRITSQTSDTLGYNQCSSRSIERQQGGNWVAHPEPGRMCTMELRLLMPNERQTATTDLPDDLSAGTYRVVLNLSRQRSAPPGAAPGWGTLITISPSFRVE